MDGSESIYFGDESDGDVVNAVRGQALEISGMTSFTELAATLLVRSLRARFRTSDAERLQASYKERYGQDPEQLILAFL